MAPRTPTEKRRRRVPRTHIARLPNQLLKHVLSLLPAADAGRTSMLSRRWRHLWKSAPALRFSADDTISAHRLLSRAHAALAGSNAGSLRSFDLAGHFAGHHMDEEIESCLLSALRLGAQEVSLDGNVSHKGRLPYVDSDNESDGPDDTSDGREYLPVQPAITSDDDEHVGRRTKDQLRAGVQLHDKFFFSSASLRTLRLKACTLDLTWVPSLHLLETLELTSIVAQRNAFQRLVAGCPALKTLTADRCSALEKLLTISGDRLESVMLSRLTGTCGVSIDSPVLKAFRYHGQLPMPGEYSFSMTRSPDLEYVELFFPTSMEWSERKTTMLALRSFVGELGHAKILALSSGKIEDLALANNLTEEMADQPLLPGVRRLKIKGDAATTSADRAVASLLVEAPELESLTVSFTPYHNKPQPAKHVQPDGDGGSGGAPAGVRGARRVVCLRRKLKELNMRHFLGDAMQCKVAMFLMERGLALETVYVKGAKETVKHHERAKRSILTWRANRDTKIIYY